MKVFLFKFLILCNAARYHLRVDCDKLKMHPINSKTTTKSNLKRSIIYVLRKMRKLFYNMINYNCERQKKEWKTTIRTKNKGKKFSEKSNIADGNPTMLVITFHVSGLSIPILRGCQSV